MFRANKAPVVGGQDEAALVFINTLVQVADFTSYLVKSAAAVACQRPAAALAQTPE